MTRLKTVLEGYETWTLPFPEEPATLDKAQRTANLDWVLANKQARIAALRAALPEIDRCFAPLLDAAQHPFVALRDLDLWWAETGLQLSLFPPVAGGLRSKLFKGRYYAANAVLAIKKWYEWDENPLVLPLDSLLRDIGLVMGEAIVLRRPDFVWAVNEDTKEKRSQTVEWGRLVVMREAKADFPLKAFDLFNLARWSYSDLHWRKQNRLGVKAVDVGGGDWRGPFVGWTVLSIVDGGYTDDHYPAGRDGPPVAGRWPSSPAVSG